MGTDPQSNQRLRSNLRDERSILGLGKTRLRPMYEILSEFFNCLDASIRLLQLRGLMPSFTNLCPKIKCLTDRFLFNLLFGLLKFVLPKVVEITKVLVKDGITNNMKPDLRVTMKVDAVENDDKLKYEGGGHMHLRRAFHHRLGEISKSHLEGYEILEETLPQPFNCAEQHMHQDTIKCSLSSSPEALTGVHTVKQPEAFKISHQGDATAEALIEFYHDSGSMIKYHKNLTAKGYRALIYSGDHDMCVPFTGSEAWTRSLGYKIVDEWRPWTSNGQVAGYTQGYENNLTFLTVKGSGHTVPEYKPREAFDLFSRFLAGKPQ
ncbi:hypothetical protein DVH24_028486 [Malus domestica]|uniref:CDT1 Geminin-binding domain-containing protein n=1 Tax=Malus domestica TaxID=3750 RepID=A0A498IUP0_MALDO|nr:hypothetical protein DVH24_028486 [Malus domestica]